MRTPNVQFKRVDSNADQSVQKTSSRIAAPEPKKNVSAILAILLVITMVTAGVFGYQAYDLSGKLAATEASLSAKTVEQEETALKLAETEASLTAMTAEQEKTAAKLAAMEANLASKTEEHILTKTQLERVEYLTGDLIAHGHYEQDGDPQSVEPIMWRVLKTENGKAFVVSESILEGMVYHQRMEEVTWATCDLRTWLNGEFLDSAFTKEEQRAILTTTVLTPAHPDYPIEGYNGCRSEDKLFLLSYQEIKELIPSRMDRLASATEWADKTTSVSKLSDKPWWWLRTPGESLQHGAYISNNYSAQAEGTIGQCPVNDVNTKYNTTGGVRPAMWIDLSMLDK